MTDTTTLEPTVSGAQTSSPGWTIPTRRVSFAERIEGLPPHFAQDGNPIFCHLAAAFSAILPDGEAFFVASVRHYRDQITDPELKRQVAGFIGQESVHGREHRELDAKLAELGYLAKNVEWLERQYIRIFTRLRSPMTCLAHTAASEHITAIVAELVMRDPEIRAMFGPQIGDILLWHCLEESEHKAVSFDVYRAIGGSERQRVRSAREVRWCMASAIAGFVVIGLIGDRDTYRPGRLRRAVRQLKASPLMRREVWDQLKAYERADFHPNERDTQALVEEWRAELFGDTGTLTPLLADSRR